MKLQLRTLLLCALGLLACGTACRRSSPTMSEANGNADADLGARANLSGRSEYLFDPPRVIPLSFDIPAAELDAMLKDSHKYGRCTMQAGNLSLAEVGIRYKGNPAKESASGKPDFNLEFNEF